MLAARPCEQTRDASSCSSVVCGSHRQHAVSSGVHSTTHDGVCLLLLVEGQVRVQVVDVVVVLLPKRAIVSTTWRGTRNTDVNTQQRYLVEEREGERLCVLGHQAGDVCALEAIARLVGSMGEVVKSEGKHGAGDARGKGPQQEQLPAMARHDSAGDEGCQQRHRTPRLHSLPYWPGAQNGKVCEGGWQH